MKSKDLILKNHYVLTPLQSGGEKVTLETLLIESIVAEIRDSNNGAKYRQLYFSSCYTDSNKEYYKEFFRNLFTRLNKDSSFRNPTQHVFLSDISVLNLRVFSGKRFKQVKGFSFCG